MQAGLKPRGVSDRVRSRATGARDQRLEQLIGHLPARLRSTIRWLRQPGSFWIRVPAGVLLICGGLLSFLPIFAFWMLPLGLLLLAEDVPPLRTLISRVLDWIGRRRPHWLAPPPEAAEPSRRGDNAKLRR